MKRITFGFMSTISALVLLFGYRTSTSSHASTATASVASGSAGSGTSGSSSSSSSSGSSGSSSGSSGSSSGGSATAVTVTGDSTDTRWGPVQVQITVANGKITSVKVVDYPNNNGRDQQINAEALPILIDETVKAQSSKIDMVSGATVTSQGYITSLQSAIDKAGL
jgi:uncharacterized protein with FMN-binding domain